MSRGRIPKRRSARPKDPGARTKRAGKRGAGRRSDIGSPGPAFRLPRPKKKDVEISKPGDRYEREADAAAKKVMAGERVPSVSKIAAGDVSRKDDTASEKSEKEEDKAQALQRVEEKAAEDEKEAAQTLQREATEDEVSEEDKEAAQTLQREAAEDEATEEDKEAAQTLQREAAEDEATEEDKEAAQTLQREAAEDEATEEGKEAAQTLQRETAKDEEEETAARKVRRAPAGGQSAMQRTAAQAIASKGPGKPLAPPTRRRLEHGLGTDLGGVRVHDSAADREAARGLNARAFTHGNDIWLGPGESQQDVQLMAHEATHVVQQGAGVSRSLVQRDGEGSASEFTAEDGTRLNVQSNELEVPEMSLPNTANKRQGISEPFTVGATEERGDQLAKWRREIGPAGLNRKVNDMLPDSAAIPTQSGRQNFYLKIGTSDRLLAGSKRRIQSQVKRPNWTASGEPETYDVDHIKELQLGGSDSSSNYQLLNSSTNRSSGSQIKNERDRRIAAGLRTIQTENPDAELPSLDIVKGYTLKVQRIADNPLELAGSGVVYTFNEVKNGALLAPLHLMTPAEVEARPELQGNPNRLQVFLVGGAAPIRIPWQVGVTEKRLNRRNFGGIQGFDARGISYTVGGSATITGRVAERVPAIAGTDLSITLEELGTPYTLQGSPDGVQQQLRNAFAAAGMSPIEITSADLTSSAFEAHGVLRPTVNILPPGASIDLSINGDSVMLSKTFSGPELAIPGPVEITGSSLTIALGSRGFEVGGAVNFEVEHVGTGTFSARFSTATGLTLTGSFDVDPELVDQGHVTLSYNSRTGVLSGNGVLGMNRGKFKGVESARGTFTVNGDSYSASGTIVAKIPGIERPTLSIVYSTETGWGITGSFEFGQNVPRLTGGRVEVSLSKADGGAWKLAGSGSASFDLSGVDARVSVSYDDGVVTAEVTAGYERGIASGNLTLGVTNQAVEDGEPVGGAGGGGTPSDTLTPYGKGEVTLQFTPWLQGTIGLELTPAGALIASGELALPSSLEVFPEKKIERELVSIGVDIPIVGVAVAGQRVGIFLNISGGLTAKAGFGPGKLENVSIGVTYNPEEPENTRITGSADFVVPAEAGLRLAIQGSIGAGIPIVSARAGIEVGGELGIDAEARAGVRVSWSPSEGVKLDAEASISAQPKLKFDVSGFVTVEADLLLTTVELYSKRWQLAAFEYGPGLELGATLPIHYESGKPFDISFDDIEFTTPDVNPTEVLEGLIKEIA